MFLSICCIKTQSSPLHCSLLMIFWGWKFLNSKLFKLLLGWKFIFELFSTKSQTKTAFKSYFLTLSNRKWWKCKLCREYFTVNMCPVLWAWHKPKAFALQQSLKLWQILGSEPSWKVFVPTKDWPNSMMVLNTSFQNLSGKSSAATRDRLQPYASQSTIIFLVFTRRWLGRRQKIGNKIAVKW